MLFIEPAEEYLDRIAEYRAEFLSNGDSMDGTGPLRRCADPAEWLAKVNAGKYPESTPPGLVPATQYIYVREDDGRIVGMLQIRHCLNDYTEVYAGHIGYSVAPGERRKGYASQMLAAALPICRELGIKKVLITCDRGNEGSRRTILKHGGTYESTVYEANRDGFIERYWIDLNKKSKCY